MTHTSHSNRWIRIFRWHVCLLAIVSVGSSVRADDTPESHFTKQVRPLLASRCFSCHGPDEVKGALRLDSREAVLKGGERGVAVVPAKPDESLLLRSVKHLEEGLAMPPKEKLRDEEIAALERWIRDGAPWPVETATAAGEKIGDAWSDPRNPIVRIFRGQRLDLWSLKPVRVAPMPAVAKEQWVRSPLDRFVLARLEKAGLAPAAEADRRTLLRRVSFDITGLPPTPDDMAVFLADVSPDAYERAVDRLLGSSRYGEHWARLWLDVVRYSDSNGFDWDEFRPQAWRFRDYVIRSFNADKPYDEFVREQLAGDELLAGPPQSPADQDRLIATGYLRMGPHDNAASLFNEQDRSRAELLADLTETTASAFLGLTFACCRCHDHKYDPLSHADHFRLRAFFTAVRFADDIPLDVQAEQDAVNRHNAEIDAEIQTLEQRQESLSGPVRERLRGEKLAKLAAEERALVATPEDKRTDEIRKQLERIEANLNLEDKEIIEAFDEKQKQEHASLGKEIEAARQKKRAFTHALLMTDGGEVPVTKVLFQGNHKAEREAVEPGFLSALNPSAAAIAKGQNASTTGRRLTLANWIASPKNPLTARVLVNRVWQAYFGTGLVRTPNDFGLAGSPPTHPELLDWLADRFMREGWSLKRLHREIVLSATYRQAAVVDDATRQRGEAVDADNALLWKHSPRRLSAEQLRDAVLAVSGRLRTQIGGKPVWPELPADVLQANPAFLDDNETKTKGWYPSPPHEQPCRSIYLIQKRNTRVPFLETFDLPDNSVSCACRETSIVAPQALSLLNGPEFLEAATAFAQRVQGNRDPIGRAFVLAFQRAPDAEERARCEQFLKEHTLAELCRALLNVNEFAYRD